MDTPEASHIDLFVVVTNGGAQDCCLPTTHYTHATWAEPHRSHDPRAALLPVTGVGALAVHDQVMAGDVRPGCHALDGIARSGWLHLREVAAELATIAADLCVEGASCLACSDSDLACLQAQVEDVRATSISSDVTGVDRVTSHPDCASSTCDDPSAGRCADWLCAN